MKNAKFWIVLVVLAMIATAVVETCNRPIPDPVEQEKMNQIIDHSEIPDTLNNE